MTDREPYVGEGEDGARRSARIDREEAEGLDWTDPRRDQLIESAAQWEEQATQLMLERVGGRPHLDQVREGCTSSDWLAAFALLDLSPALTRDAARFTRWDNIAGSYDSDRRFQPDALLDWDRWVADVAAAGRGWSSGESALFSVIAGIMTEQEASLKVLRQLGSWQMLSIVVQWASDGQMAVTRT